MASQFGAGTLVDYAGARWRVQRVLGVEAVMLRSETGEEIAADPLKIQLLETLTASERQILPIDELRYSDADWAAATRRRDCIAELAGNSTRTTSDVTSAAAALGLSPRRIWSLLRQMESTGAGVAQFLPARGKARRKRLSTAVEAIIEQAIDQHYAKRSRPGLQSLVNEVAGRCAAAGLNPASSKAVKARVRARNQVWLVGRREGRAKTRSLRLLTGAHPGAEAPWVNRPGFVGGSNS